jgi:hypothetical protein
MLIPLSDPIGETLSTHCPHGHYRGLQLEVVNRDSQFNPKTYDGQVPLIPTAGCTWALPGTVGLILPWVPSTWALVWYRYYRGH